MTVALPASAAPTDAGWKQVVQDSFDRTHNGFWGDAPVGGRYVVAYNSQPDGRKFSVSGGMASVSAIEPAKAAAATLADVSVRDVELETTLSIPAIATTGFGVYHAIQARRQSDGANYRGRIKISDGGVASVDVTKYVGGAETSIGGAKLPFAVKAGQAIVLALRVTGSSPVTLGVRAWPAGTTTPAWQFTGTDSSSTKIAVAGSVGLWSYVSASSGAVTVQTRDLNAWGLATTSPAAPTTTTAAPAPTTPTAAPAPTTTAAPAPTTTTTTAAPAAPAAPAEPAATGGRGSATVGSTAYAVPSGAMFVDAARGSDAAAGTQAAPFKTVNAAVSKAASGRTIVLRGGNYHEQVTIPAAKTGLIIQAYPNEAVWFDGSSVVTGWAASGTRWVKKGWTKSFDDSISFTTGSDNMSFINPAYPMAADPDQVFVNGAQLRQVATAAQVVAGTFAVDYAADTITIGSDPTGKEVRSSDLEQAFNILGVQTTLRGVGVRRYGTPIPGLGAVRAAVDRATFTDVVLTDNATVGMSFGGNNAVADRVTVTKSGLLGMHSNHADYMTIKNSLVTYNNSENFNGTPASSGIKLTRSRHLTIANNDVSNNAGGGIWLDESVVDFKIVNNRTVNNATANIEAELSETGIIAGNVSTGGNEGILIFNSGNVKIFNNAVGANRIQDINLSQNQRRQATWSVGRDPRQPVPDPTNPWILRNITIANNILGGGGMRMVWVIDKATGVPADDMNILLTGNLFSKKTGTTPRLLAWGQANATVVYYDTVAAIKARKPTFNNAETASAKLISQMAADAAAASGITVALPADVAAAAGQTAGAKKMGPWQALG